MLEYLDKFYREHATKGIPMGHQVAAVFKNGGSQAVRLPSAFRFDTDHVYVRRDENGDVVLSTRPGDWDAFIETVTGLKVPDDFLDPDSRRAADRDLFKEFS